MTVTVHPRSTWFEAPSVFVRGSRKNWVGIGAQHPSSGRLCCLLHIGGRWNSQFEQRGQTNHRSISWSWKSLSSSSLGSASAVRSSSSLLTSAMAMAVRRRKRGAAAHTCSIQFAEAGTPAGWLCLPSPDNDRHKSIG